MQKEQITYTLFEVLLTFFVFTFVSERTNTMQDVISERFEYDGVICSYKKTGTGPPLLLLHGWGSSSEVMLPLARSLCTSYTCYLPDFPGFGDSDAPGTAWDVDAYANFTEALIHQLHIEGCRVLAHSFGGRVMLKLMARPHSVTLIGKVLITGGAGMKPRRKPSFYIKKYTAKLLKAPFVILPATLRDKGLQALRSTPLWKSLGSSDYRSLDGIMRAVFVKTVGEHLEGCLPEIQHEVLLLWGTDDDATPLYQAEKMEKGMRNAALVTIDGAGHYAFIDQPFRFVRIAEAYYNG